MSAKVSAQQKILNSFENIEDGLNPIQAMKEVRKIESKQIMNLTLKENPEGYELMLDNQKLRYVEGYRIVKSSNQSGTAELTLKILVKFTQDDDSEKDIQRFVDDFIKMDSKEVGKLLGKGDEKKLRS